MKSLSVILIILIIISCKIKDKSDTIEMPESKNEFIYGIGSVLHENISEVLDIDVSFVALAQANDQDVLENTLITASEYNIMLGSKGHGTSRYTSDGKIDKSKMISLITDQFPVNNSIINDPSYLYHYVIDEPCDNDDFTVTESELKDLYTDIKKVDKKIPVLINFDVLFDCLIKEYLPDDLCDCETWKIADYVSFVISEKKIAKNPDYITLEIEAAEKAKRCNPDLKIIAFIEAYEFSRDGTVISQLPSPEWLKDVGMKIIKEDIFDGIMYFPWDGNPNYASNTIKTVNNKSEYISAIKEVFSSIGKP